MNREKRLCGIEAKVTDFISRKDVTAVPDVPEAGMHIPGYLYMNRKESQP